MSQIRYVTGPIQNIQEWPSAASFAASLGVTTNYVYRLIQAGTLAVVETQLGYLLEPGEARAYAQRRRERLATYRGRPGPRQKKHSFRLDLEASEEYDNHEAAG
jgi:hypothetical protein